jgi:hypothetical protein
MDTVFYSWQSDLDNKTNRFFIGAALEGAVTLLKRDGLEVAPRIDQDARDCPGAPDIATELFRKITACRVFVADVSIINGGAFVGLGGKKFVGLSKEGAVYKHRQEKPCRPTPNPNVMIELGFAAHALTWDRVICVVNEACGKIETLPFDIRSRGMVKYYLLPTTPVEERKQKRTNLRTQLKYALEIAVARNEAERAEQERIAAEAERQRQNAILQELRMLWSRTATTITTDTLQGLLPKEWVDVELAKRGETWRRDQYYTE